MSLQLVVSPAVYFNCCRIDDASGVRHRERDYLLAANESVVFAVDLQNAFCFALESRKNLRPWHAAVWQSRLPHLDDTDESTVVCRDNYGALVRQGAAAYCMYSFAAHAAVLRPASRQRVFGAPLIDAVFFRGAQDAVVLLFEKRLTMELCVSWFGDDEQPVAEYAATPVSAKPFLCVATDHAQHIVVYGECHVAVYGPRLAFRWQHEYDVPIIQCWLTPAGVGVFCLLRDGAVELRDRRGGQLLVQLPPATTGPCLFAGNVVVQSLRVFAAHSADDAAENTFYIVTQLVKSSGSERGGNVLTQVQALRVRHVFAPPNARQLVAH